VEVFRELGLFDHEDIGIQGFDVFGEVLFEDRADPIDVK
jgi:hypothetical protein